MRRFGLIGAAVASAVAVAGVSASVGRAAHAGAAPTRAAHQAAGIFLPCKTYKDDRGPWKVMVRRPLTCAQAFRVVSSYEAIVVPADGGPLRKLPLATKYKLQCLGVPADELPEMLSCGRPSTGVLMIATHGGTK